MATDRTMYNKVIRTANAILFPIGISEEDLPDTNSAWDYMSSDRIMSVEEIEICAQEYVMDRLYNSDLPGAIEMADQLSETGAIVG